MDSEMRTRAASYTKDDVLRLLDKTVQEKSFPVLDNYSNYLAAARLTVWRSPKHWLLFFEIVGYSPPENEFVNHIYMIGNCVKEGVQMKEKIFVSETAENPIRDREEGKWLADWQDWEVLVRGEVHKFHPSPAEYRNAGIEIDPTKPGPGSLRHDKLIRFLVLKLRDELFCTVKEMRELLPDKKLQSFMQFEDWKHPDIRKGELPSQNPFFIALAGALAGRSKHLPESALENPNTHWSNWPLKWV
jgi:hypothetical protein